MVTTYYNPADIEHACAMIRRTGETPILYVSKENAAKLSPFCPIDTPDNNLNIDQKPYPGNDGFMGTHYGCYVYVTDAVGDLWVVVPLCKENKK